MKPSGTVLILSDATAEWRGVTTVFGAQRGYRVLHSKTEAEARTTLGDVHVDVIVADAPHDVAEMVKFLGALQIAEPDLIRVLIVSPGAAVTRRAVIETGAFQFLRRPLDAQQIVLAVQRGLECREMMRRQRFLARDFKLSDDWLEFGSKLGSSPLPGESRNFEKLVYVSEKMRDLCDLAREAARTDQLIHIQGETGTGKELLARALHFHSDRRAGNFIIQNCTSMTDTFLQAELFGHEKGAPGGSEFDRIGLFRAAEGGTLFLDEISDISASLQLGLLHFVQTGEIKSIGASRGEPCNVRLLTGSTRPLISMVEAGQFRQDLYFRLRAFELELPALRERPEDIPVLAEFFTAKHSTAMRRRILGISANALEKLAAYGFPGNVRELESEIRRMVAVAKDDSYLTSSMMSPALLTAVGRKSFSSETRLSFKGHTLKEKIENLEKQVVREALARHKWNRSRVADELGLSRVGLANKIKRYGLNEHSSNSD